MSEPTYTRAEIRKDIARRMHMRFFQRFDEYSTFTASSIGTPRDSALAEVNDFWNSAWMYVMTGSAADDVRILLDFVQSTGGMALNRNLSAAPDVGSRYQLFDYDLSPFSIHDAINKAIAEALPAFFQVSMDETLILEEDKLEYSLTALSPSPWKIHQMWLEIPYTVISGTVTSATTNTATVPGSLSDVNSSWKLSIYNGTGSGQIRNVSSVSGQQVTLTAVWTTTPDSTSKFKLWDPTDQKVGWYFLPAFRTDKLEFPSTLYLEDRYASYYGYRLRIQHLNQPQALTTDAGTTVVPKEFVVLWAMGILWESLSTLTRADRQGFERRSLDLMAKALQYKMANAFTPPSTTIRVYSDPNNPSAYYGSENPLGW